MDNQGREGGSSLFKFIQSSLFNLTEQVDMDQLATARSMLLTSLKRQYFDNDYFAGGLSLMITAFLSNFFYAHLRNIFSLFVRKRTSCVIHVKEDEQAFEWLEEWLSVHASKDSLNLKLQTKWEENGIEKEGGDRPRVYIIPQMLEAHTIIFQGQKVTFQSKAEASESKDSSARRVTLVMEGPNRKILEAIIDEAIQSHFTPEYRTSIRRWNVMEFAWDSLATKVARPIDSVILDVDIENILKDARTFLSSGKWYIERGIPHRRGYLLWGPPGCGKSSVIQVLAGELGFDVSTISLSSKEMSDELVNYAMCTASSRSILVLEDVDALFTQRMDGKEKNNNLSFSGLLNAIDGISAQEGRLLVMTTNHLENLDPALIRPGRVDVRVFLGLATHSQSQRMFQRFYPQSSVEEARGFAEKIPEGTLSPATLQGYFLLHRESMDEALRHVEDLVERKSKDTAPLLVPDDQDFEETVEVEKDVDAT